jgi:polyhydroxyalkanoate synthesis regulator phasin
MLSACLIFLLMNAAAQIAEETKIARMLRELQSDMADLVASGDMTADQANEWVNAKADQWAQGLS